VIGVGTLDSGDLAVDFIESTGTYSFPMYWDDTGVSWLGLEVISQPAAVLYAPDGSELARWQGEFDLNEVFDHLDG
jgi:hypothetical protein